VFGVETYVSFVAAGFVTWFMLPSCGPVPNLFLSNNGSRISKRGSKRTNLVPFMLANKKCSHEGYSYRCKYSSLERLPVHAPL
jgi:hypothetical protein